MTKGLLLYSNSLEPLPAVFVRNLQLNYERFYVIQMLRNEESGIALPDQFSFEHTKVINVKVGPSIMGKIVGFLQVMRFVIVISPTMISAWNWELIVLSRIYSMFTKVTLFPSIQDTREWMYTKIGKSVMCALVKSHRLHLTSSGYANELFKDKPQSDILILPNVPFFPVIESRALERSKIKTVGYFGFIRGDEALKKILSAMEKINRKELKMRFHFAGIGPGVNLVKNCGINGVEYLGQYNHRDIGKMYSKVDAIFGVYDKSKDKVFHSSYRFMDAIHYGKQIFLLANSSMYQEVKQSDLAYPLSFDEDWVKPFQNFIESNGKNIDTSFLVELRKRYIFPSYLKSFKRHYSIEFTINPKFK